MKYTALVGTLRSETRLQTDICSSAVSATARGPTDLYHQSGGSNMAVVKTFFCYNSLTNYEIHVP